jgi:trimeric autotransporter adhesin
VAASVALSAFLLAANLECRAQAEAQASFAARPLVRELVDDSDRVTLSGNVHPMAQAKYDLGAVDDSFAAARLYLVLKRTPEQEQALRQFLQDAHTAGSASYHQWLAPEEFGKRFGAADSDISALTAWLESHGFTVNNVHPGRVTIEFSGNAAQVSEAFHTEIHSYSIHGVMAYANAADPQIPAAFADLVSGVSPMQSFHAKPLVRVAGRTSYDQKTHQAQGEWTYPEPSYAPPYFFELAPADFAVQYNLGPVYAAGTTGAGESIGILSASNVDLSLVAAYRALFGLPANLPTVVVDGNDPGQNEDATEAYLDVEESGAIAPAAKVVLYTSAGTVLTDPLLTSGLRAVEDNQISVLSMSYGACEAALGASGNAAWAALWQEAAAQGITVFVSAGDGGSAGCDDFDTEGFAESGLAVNGYGSTPYNVSVGGTDFYYSDYATGGSALATQIGTYWSAATANSPKVSLLQPVPEQAWNNAFGMNAIGGGKYNSNASTIVAGSGGASSAAVYPASGPVTGYPKPAWQAGTGVPADKVRDVPDISLFAADGPNYVYYPICAYSGDCTTTSSSGAVYITSVGGTSATSPAMAGIQALVDQAVKSRQGQADYVYYALATKTASAAAKPFNDVKTGGNEVPCFQGTLGCVLGMSGQTKGSYAESGYAATAGYDRATGLGTVNVANLISDWSTIVFKPTTTTLTVTPATLAHGAKVSVKATVAPKTGTGTPTGSIGLASNDAQAYSNGLGVFTLAGGTVTSPVDSLPGGTYQVVADYSGDSSYGSSVSAPVTITVTPEKDTLDTSGWVLNPIDDYVYPLAPGMSIPYGSAVYLDALPVGVNEAGSTPAQNVPATGAVTFTDKLAIGSKTGIVPLNSVGLAEWIPAAPAVGSHTISAAYAGDASYAASTAPSAAMFTVFKGTTTIYVYPMETNVAAGSSVTVDVEMFSDYLPLNGTLPSGNVSVTLGGKLLTAPWSSWGTAGGTIQEAVVTFTNVPAGVLPLTASYAGDANWYGTSSLYGSITSLASKPAPAVTLTTATASYTPTQMVTMTGTVIGKTGGAAPSGTLYFTWEDGAYSYSGTLQKTANSAAFTLSFPANQLANGANLFVATFRGDANYSAQSSAPLAITLKLSDFSVTTPTPEVSVPFGKSAIGTIALSPIDGYSGAVAITCSAPAEITCSASVVAPSVGSAGATDTITFKIAGTVAAGTYPAVITATGGGHTHTTQILVANTPPAATPVFSLAAGTYVSAQTVSISDATPAATIFYTTDGSTPTNTSAVFSAAIQVNATETLRALASAPGYPASPVASAVFTITPPAAAPSFSPAAKSYAAAQSVTISDATKGATIYYTTNGSTPTTASAKYTSAVKVSATVTLKAVAIATGYSLSPAASGAYIITAAAATPPSRLPRPRIPPNRREDR